MLHLCYIRATFMLYLCYICATFVLHLCYICVIVVLHLCYICVTFVGFLCYICVIFVLHLCYICVIFVLYWGIWLSRSQDLQAGLRFCWVSGSAPIPHLEKKLREMAVLTLPENSWLFRAEPRDLVNEVGKSEMM